MRLEPRSLQGIVVVFIDIYLFIRFKMPVGAGSSPGAVDFCFGLFWIPIFYSIFALVIMYSLRGSGGRRCAPLSISLLCLYLHQPTGLFLSSDHQHIVLLCSRCSFPCWRAPMCCAGASCPPHPNPGEGGGGVIRRRPARAAFASCVIKDTELEKL